MKKARLISLTMAAAILSSMAAAKVSAEDIYFGPYNILPQMEARIEYSEETESPDDNSTFEAEKIYINSFYGTGSYSFRDNLTDRQKTIYDSIRSALSVSGNMKCTIPISMEYIADMSAAYSAIMMDLPEFTDLKAPSYAGNSQESTIFFYGSVGSDEESQVIAANYDNVMNKAKSIVAGSSGCANRYEKIEFFAKYLCDNVQYNYEAALYGPTVYGNDPWSAYGSLINGNSVCEGYAEAFKILCDMSEIPCVLIRSNTHEWNAVLINNVWYYVDVTWMDSGSNGNYRDQWLLCGTNSATDSDHQPTSKGIIVGVDNYVYPTVSAEDFVYTGTADENPESPSEEEPVISEADQKIYGFVERLYSTMLNRASDPDGKQHWFTRLKNGDTAAVISSRFVLSEEMKGLGLSNEEFITRMYHTFMDREPDAEGLAHWKEQMDNGCTSEYLLMKFVASQEFVGICDRCGIQAGTYTPTLYRDQSPNLTAFVSRLYTKALNRKYDSDGLEHWTKSYITKTYTLDQIAAKIIFSTEFMGRNLSDEEFVECMYATFFDRHSDPGGKQHWLDILASGGTREDVFSGFIRAQEYRDLISSFGL